MKGRNLFRHKAFTLIELMVVVTIIAILAALIVPALQRVTAKVMAVNCMAKVKAVGGAIRTYASVWGGYTNPDKDYYVALMDYRIDIPGSQGTGWATPGYFGEPPGWASDSTSASYKYCQSEVKTFRCPVDEAPATTKHAVKSSYRVSALFAGGNVMNLPDEANRTLMVSEIGKRHPVGLTGTEGNYVYADLHATLGYTGPAMPGAWLRIWHSGVNTSYFARPANNVGLTSAPKYEDSFYGGNWDFGIDFYRNLVWGLLGTGTANDWWLDPSDGWYNWRAHEGRPRYPQNWLARVDALFKPPASGTWQFQVAGDCYQQVYLGVGSAVANPAQGFDQAPTVTMYRRDWWLQGAYWNDNSCSKQISNMDSGQYYPIVFFSNGCCWSGGDYVRARRMDAAGNVDANYSNVLLNTSNVCRIP